MVCVFWRSCFIRFAAPFVLELHTYCSSSSLTLVCLYAFKRFSLHALLCSFILYIHIYVFPFHAFCSRCRKRICSPKGFTFVTGCGAALRSHARISPIRGDVHPKWCYFRVIFILNYEVSPLRVMPLWGGWIRGCATHGYWSAAPRARGACVFWSSCFIRFAVPFVLEVHTCRHTTSFVLVCLYAFKRSSLHALLCPFILYMHTYGFLFMRFVLYAEEDMQPEGLNFRNRVWRSLA